MRKGGVSTVSRLPKLCHKVMVSGVILCVCAVLLPLLIIVRFCFIKPVSGISADTGILALLTDTGEKEVSAGYDAGGVFSIDGKQIAKTFRSENGWSKLCGIPGYNGVLGSEGCGGAVYRWYDVLHSTASPVNRQMRCGNTIQTTLYSTAQEYAAEQLAEHFPESVCADASVCVVLRDGAVLVDAGSNACTQEDYFSDEKAPKIHENYAAIPIQTGSVIKAPMARILQLHDAELPPEWSVYSDTFQDISYYNTANGICIHNHDYKKPSSYELNDHGLYTRNSSLAQALIRSSNTYFLRHMLTLGGNAQRAYQIASDTYGLFEPIETEIATLEPVTCPEERLMYYFWGQNFYCSPIRLCEIYNHALSGDAYTPFFVSTVYLPDQTVIYQADPQPRGGLHFDVQQQDILKDALAQCFTAYGISDAVTNEYSELIAQKRLLTKSGTAETADSRTNAVRVLSVLDENMELTATACIAVHDQKEPVSQDLLYQILLETLHAAKII